MERRHYDGISITNQRTTNMDSLLLKEQMIEGETVYLAVVSDGVGSTKDGAYASATAIKMLGAWFAEQDELERIELRLRSCVLQINQTILKSAAQYQLNTAATLSVLLLARRRYYIVHLGDSRIYGWQKENITLLTQDQVSETGKLTSCLGHMTRPQIIYNEGEANKTSFLLCSDGLYKRMSPGFLTEQLKKLTNKNMKKTLEKLAQYAIERGEKDNITLALILSGG